MSVTEAAGTAAKLPLTFACGLYDRMLRLYTGEVQPRGIDLRFLANDEPRDIFDRMGGKFEFDASEMSSSEFISRFGTGHCPFVAIPVFASRLFRHGFIFFNRKAGIRTPKDLEGKRVGVPLYTMSAAIWIRGLLQHDYGVDLASIRWVQGALKKAGAHGSPTVAPLLKEPTIEINQSGKSLSELLADGDIDDLGGALGHRDRARRELVTAIAERQPVLARRHGVLGRRRADRFVVDRDGHAGGIRRYLDLRDTLARTQRRHGDRGVRLGLVARQSRATVR